MSPVPKLKPPRVAVKVRHVDDPDRLQRLAELLADLLDTPKHSGQG